MKNTIFVILLIIAFSLSVYSQSNKNISLLVKNCDENETVCSTQHLVRYVFSNGDLVSKEKLLTTKTLDLRFDLGGNQIYKNRYIVTMWGDVFDIDTKTVLNKSEGELVEIVGDDLIIKVNKEDNQGIFFFNLLTKESQKLPSPNIYEAEGEISPDKTRVVNYYSRLGLVIEDFKTKSKKVKKIKLNVGLSEVASEMGKVPLFWLDNERILTQRKNGEIIVININGKISSVVNIPVKENPYISPTIYQNSRGQIFYDIGNEYVIDIENKTYKPVGETQAGEFIFKAGESEPTYIGNTQNIIFFQEKEIGRFWASSISTHNNFIAVQYSNDGKPESLGSPKGIKVWNNIKNDWTTLEIKWSPQIIGWINE